MYSKIKLHGYCDVNYIWSKNNDLGDDEIKAIIEAITDKGIYTPEWDADTVTLSTFQDTLNGNSNVQDTNITGYVVQRKRTDENRLYKVVEVPKENTVVYDYNIQNNNEFTYRIIPKLNDGTYSSFVESNPISVKWDYITICDLLPTDIDNEYIVDKNNLWKFGLNTNSTAIKPNFTKNVMTGFGQFPKISHNETNYLTLGFETLLGDVDCAGRYFNDNIDKLEKWHSFCNNGNIKLLKDMRGNVIPCDIQDTSMDSDENTFPEITVISFNVIQLYDRKSISAYDFEDEV